MDRPRISVAMCTYNGEKYLMEQLESIAAQTALPAELVICDDGSKDRTIEIIQDFIPRAPFPVQVQINPENLGVARNFFKAIKLCQEEWVMLCDQDDVWLKERVALFTDAIQKHCQARAIISDAILVDAALKPMNQTLFGAYRLTRRERQWLQKGQAHRALVRHVFATGAAMVVRRTFAVSIPEPEAGFLHDEWIAWFSCPFLSLIEKPTIFYRQHGRQVTGIDGRIGAQAKRLSQPQAKSVVLIEEAVVRFATLGSQLARFSLSPSTVQKMLSGKVRFLKKRSSLSNQLVRRFIDIVFKIGLADYWRYGSGVRTIIKDAAGTKRL